MCSNFVEYIVGEKIPKGFYFPFKFVISQGIFIYIQFPM